MSTQVQPASSGEQPGFMHPALPWVLPFAVFMVLLMTLPSLALPAQLDLALRVLLPAAAILFVARPALDFRVSSFSGSVAIGAAVFVIWVAPDLLFPGYRYHWLFQNAVTGSLSSTLSGDARNDAWSLTLRICRAVAIVPIVEELFWRGWLMRWAIHHDFRSVPLGTYARVAFWSTAALFALEHGPYWDVGFLAGAVYNWWIVRTKRLGDLFLAHAVTNACLAAYVLISGKWEYWM